MNWILVCIVIIGLFLYYNRNKVVYPSYLPGTQQYIRLWQIPFFQLLICCLFLLGAKMNIEMLLSKSPFMSQIIEDNLGIFSSIASDVFNKYRTEELAPYIEKANEVHKYTIYLFYGSIANFLFHIYVLKNKVCSKDLVLCLSAIFSAIILIVGYISLYNSDLSSSALISTETIGIWGISKENSKEYALGVVSTIGLFLFFINYYQKVWLLQYYDGMEAIKSNNDDEITNKLELSLEKHKLAEIEPKNISNQVESTKQTKNMFVMPDKYIKFIKSNIFPITVIVLFALGLLFFHINYVYTDYWIEESIIVICALGVLLFILITYYIIKNKRK